MAILHPFRAVRPSPDTAKEVASVPYDVISVAEARTLAAGNARSFLHVIRPEIDLPEGTDEHDDSVYRRGAENLRRFLAADYTTHDPPSLYVYRQTMGDRAQTGIFGCVSVSDYDNDVILKHEKTRPDKEDDRTRHIVEQRAHAEPVMLTFRDDDRVRELVGAAVSGDPLYDFEAVDGVRHTVWRVQQPGDLASAFTAIERLYVADGHHRCKAASRAAEALAGTDVSDEVRFFPAVLFPMSELNILAYNRVVYELPGSPEEFLASLTAAGLRVTQDAPAVPDKPGNVSIYVDGGWYSVRLPESIHTSADSRLDVARLGEHILEPILGISDPRRDARIGFVGGIRGVGALKDAVDSGRAKIAISMYPTSIDDLVAVSDAGLLMPPKSTWFEPKLRSGLLVHVF